MKKILIYRSLSALKPIGGPSGYLFNLKNGLDNIKTNDFDVSFLPENNKSEGFKNSAKASKNVIVKFALNRFRELKHLKKVFDVLYKKAAPKVDLDLYDAVHFHTTHDIYQLRDHLKTYKGKVLLTSHSPQPLSHEYIESSSVWETILFKKRFSKLIKMDEFAFSRADNIIFPCEYADEPYVHEWKDYSTIKQNKISDYRYLLTGTNKAAVNVPRNIIRDKYGIPEDAFVISYVGRHNAIKGYDKLKGICTEILKKHQNVYILVAGNIGPILPPNHERWIEVGWTNDPHSIVAASDVFVLPNKETYFDLVLLEVLSLGKIVVASNTGGNKYFDNDKTHGVQLYNSDEECIDIIEHVMKKSESERNALENQNQELFEKNFTNEVFAQNYINMLKTVL